MAELADYRLPRDVIPEAYQIELRPDLSRATFAGTVTIRVRVENPTDRLVLNAADLDITDAILTTESGAASSGRVQVDEAAQRATIAFDEPVEPGAAELGLVFTGILNDKLHGFYRSTYQDQSGHEAVLATTQFEPADARRAFPCWDEPDLKATFAVTLVVDEGLTAVSNGPVVSNEPLGDGTRRVVFAETMVMSTYLVAFVVGHFDVTDPVDVNGVPMRIVTPPGRTHMTPFALEAGRFALDFLGHYFELPYPAAKLDHVAIPDFAFGAMENLGCVTYRETALLLEREQASQLEQQRVAQVISHETAHMWFGDLVTMKWWNGIWLNEAFATFMELTTTDALRPDWDVWSGFSAGKAAALLVDGLRATRPVEFAVGPPDEAEAMFDVLTYQKGGSVLKMLEQYLGPSVFRQGIARYLSKHQYGNTETADLWDAIETASGAPVRTIMDSWILQGGYPSISVERGSDPGSLVLSQQRFLYAGEPDDTTWSVPINLRVSVGGTVGHQKLLLDQPQTTLTFDGPVDWVVVNEGAWGFYRVRYSADLLDALAADLQVRCQPLERQSLLIDAWAGVQAGWLPLSQWTTLVRALGSEEDPDVWSAALAPVGMIDLVANDESRPALQAFVREVAGPMAARLGWDPAPGETERVGITRGRLLAALGTYGADPAVAEEATRRHTRYLEDPAGLAPDVRSAAVAIVAATGGEAGYQTVLDQYRQVTNPQEKVRYLYALGTVGDPALVRRTLDLCLGDDIRNQDAPFVVSITLGNRAGGSQAWEWVESHWDEITSRYPQNLLVRVLEGSAGLVQPGAAARVQAFLDSHELPIGGARLAQISERLQINDAFAARQRPTLAADLAAESPASNSPAANPPAANPPAANSPAADLGDDSAVGPTSIGG